MKKLILAALAGVVWFAIADVGKSTPKGFSDDFDASVKAAAESGRDLWVLFTGSDWCYWCKKLEKEVVSRPEFAVEGAKRFELVFLDFPSDSSLVRPEAVKRNRELADRFGIRGYPTILLVSSAGEKLMTAGRPEAGAKYFEAQVEKAKLGPQLARLITPYADEFRALTKDWTDKAAEAFVDVDTDDISQFNGALKPLKELAPGFRAKAKEIRKRFRAERIPDGLSEEKDELLEEMFDFIKGLRLLIEGKRDRKECGNVQPIWKLFSNTSFCDYRYRVIRKETE